ncbi:MAG TPA: fibronectin type III domain-containing protein [Fibrobacteria bacterium]|nr:fibronectin type III domain-containing protein [Fibrobacteria bacterium]
MRNMMMFLAFLLISTHIADGRRLTYAWQTPNANNANLSEGFGPRATVTPYFHLGLDVSTSNNDAFKQNWPLLAPFRCKIVKVSPSHTGTDQWITIKPVDATDVDDVSHITLFHINTQDLTEGTEYTAGAQITTMFYYSSAHSHIEAYSTAENSGYTDITSRTNYTVHPYRWWSSAATNPTITGSASIQTGGAGEISTDKWVDVTVTEPRSALNMAEVRMVPFKRGSSSLQPGYFCQGTDYMMFEYDALTGTRTGFLPGTATAGKNNGVKVIPGAFSRGATNRVTTFRWYFRSDRLPDGFEAQVYSHNGTRTNSVRVDFPSCLPPCTAPAGSPTPPVNTKAVTTGQSVKVTWDAGPGDNTPQFFSIYRRLRYNSVTSDARVVATISTAQTLEFYDYPWNPGVSGGNEYLYSVAGINHLGEGFNGAEVPAAMPSNYNYAQTFLNTAYPLKTTMADWGFIYSNWWNPKTITISMIPPIQEGYMQTTSTGGGGAVSEAITRDFDFVADRNKIGTTLSWSMYAPVGTSVKETNLLAVSLLNSSNYFLYTLCYWPTGLYDPWSGKDFELSKNNSTTTVVLASALSNKDTPTDRYINFKMHINKTTAAGGNGLIKVYYDLADGAGFRELISFKDEEHTKFSRAYFAYLTGTGADKTVINIDNIAIMNSAE